MSKGARPAILLDVTRLVWRRWRGGLPTGVDRVCLAYLEHFGPQAQAVIQRKGVYLTFSLRRSRELFRTLLDGRPDFRRRFMLFGFRSALAPPLGWPPAGALYLNVGHTGLDEPSLPKWLARHGLRAITLIHDLIPITHPQFCRFGEERKHERRMRHVLSSASGIIGNSETTLAELAALAERLALPMPPSVAAWLGGNALRYAEGPAPAKEPYFVVLGTIEGRKNHGTLLKVWRGLVARLGERTPKLVVVGARGWQADEVFRELDSLGTLRGHVVELSRCSDEELAALIAGARALLMPSFAEGYGLPVFEALELGTPVIAADLPAYREVASSIPTYLPADDIASWSRAVVSYIGAGPERTSQLNRMKGFRAPTWEQHFAKVEDWLAKLDEEHDAPLRKSSTP